MNMFDNFKNLFSSDNNAENDDLFPDTLTEDKINEKIFNDDALLISEKCDMESICW